MTSALRYVLAIDLGTSGPKVALVSERGDVPASATRRVATRFVPPRGAEQDPAEIWAAIRSAIHEVVAAAGVPSEAVAAVACASQYFSIVAVDAHGDSVAPLLLWMDARSGPHALALHEAHPRAFDLWIDVHGIPPLPSGGDSLSKILWLRDARPEIWERTHCVFEPVDWMTMRLTRRFTASVCTAFPLLLTDCRHLDILDWNTELLELAGVDRRKLPELVPPSSVIGRIHPDVADELGLPRSAHVVSGMNDTQAAAVATATFRPGGGAVNIGSTGQLIVHLDARKSDISKVLVSMPSPIAGRYMLMAENGVAAKALDHFLTSVIFADDALGHHAAEDPFAGVDAVVRSSGPGAGRLLYLPWLTGTVAPDGNPHARGAFVNVSLDTDRASMVRAVLEGVAFSLGGLLPAVETLAGHTFPELRFSGGGARSDAWAQIIADVLDRPVLPLADPVHSNNRASALLAFDALGIVGLDAVDRFCPLRARFEPRAEHRNIYDGLFTQFQAAYDGLRPVFDVLNTPRQT